MSDQTQPGDAAPSASGEGARSTGESTSTGDATSTPAESSGERRASTAEGAAAEDTTTAKAQAGDAHEQQAGAGDVQQAAGDGRDQQSAGRDDGQAPLFAAEEGDRLRGEWEAVQAAFVDDPRAAVQRAGALVSEVVQNLTESFTTAQSRLEQQWSQGEDVSTEDLRQAFHRYRSFFERLLRL
jgi:hypothetical protein